MDESARSTTHETADALAEADEPSLLVTAPRRGAAVAAATEVLAELPPGSLDRSGVDGPFNQIVTRYATMVFHVCLGVTRDRHDAEDATQAVFLTLAVQLKTGKAVHHLGPWLKQVAQRTSLDLIRGKKRRRKREDRHGTAAIERAEFDPRVPLDLDEIKGVIAEELQGMPGKYRTPLVLHYFGGMNREEMAAELGVKPATLGVRLFRGREMLGKRLRKRGVALSAVAMAAILGHVIRSIVAEGYLSMSGKAVATAGLSKAAAAMAIVGADRGARAAMMASKVKFAVAAAVLAASALAGAAEVVQNVGPVNLRNVLPNLNAMLHGLVRPQFAPPAMPRLQLSANPTKPAAPGARPMSPWPYLNINGMATTGNRISPWGAETVRKLGAASGQLLAARSNAIAETKGASPVVPQATAPIVPVALRPSHPGAAVGTPTSSAPPDVVARTGSTPGDLSNVDGSTAVLDLSSGSGGGTGTPSTVAGARGTGVGAAAASTYASYPFGPATSLSGTFSGGSMYHPAEVVDHDNTFAQTGGVNGTAQLQIAPTAGQSGTYLLQGGSIALAMPAAGAARDATDAAGTVQSVTPSIQVGVAGAGVLKLGSSFAAARITEEPGAGAPLVVRADPSASGVLRGFGSVQLTGVLKNNGRVIADGQGADQTLDLSTFRTVHHTIPNGPDGTNGWYAINRGALTLPTAASTAQPGSYIWGDAPAAATPDLVNAVKLTPTGAAAAAPPPPQSVTLSLLATDRPELPVLPDGLVSVGEWSLASVPRTDFDVQIRYDAHRVSAMGASEQDLELWSYRDGAWKNVTGLTSGLDTARNLIWGDAGAADYLSVAVAPPANWSVDSFNAGDLTGADSSSGPEILVVPEPTTFGVLALAGAGAVLLRRRRRASPPTAEK